MDEVEAMAVREPLFAKTLMLDTIQKDDQKREHFAIATFGAVPKVWEAVIVGVPLSNLLIPSAVYERGVVRSPRIPVDPYCTELLQCY
jgi:hypothetical protein